MTGVLLDTHLVQWWSAEPGRLSRRAASATAEADALAAITSTPPPSSTVHR